MKVASFWLHSLLMVLAPIIWLKLELFWMDCASACSCVIKRLNTIPWYQSIGCRGKAKFIGSWFSGIDVNFLSGKLVVQIKLIKGRAMGETNRITVHLAKLGSEGYL